MAAGHSTAFGLQISSLAIRSVGFQDSAEAQRESTAEEDTVEEDTAEQDVVGEDTAEEDIAAWHCHPVGFVRQLQLRWNLI
jgi:hypothetical protein